MSESAQHQEHNASHGFENLDDVDLLPIDKMVFGGLWERPGLSSRERSLITIAAVVATQDIETLKFHLDYFKENGGTEKDIFEIFKHLAFYLDETLINSFLQTTNSIISKHGA